MLSQRAQQVMVPTRRLGDYSFPCPEAVFGSMRVQPYIHDCLITVFDHAQPVQFLVLFKKHRHLHLNLCLSGSVSFHGELVVMRLGRGNTVVNMRPHDYSLADWVASQ